MVTCPAVCFASVCYSTHSPGTKLGSLCILLSPLIFKSNLSFGALVFPISHPLSKFLHFEYLGCLQNIIINLPLDFKIRLRIKGTNCTSNILI